MMIFSCLFIVQNWGEILHINYYGCREYPSIYYTSDEAQAWAVDGGLTFCAHPMPQPLVATIYFVSFIVVATFCLFSMFIGAITLGMASSMAEQRLLAAHNAVAPAAAGDMIRQSQHHAAQRGSTITTTTTMMMMDTQHHAVPHRNVQQQHHVTTRHRRRRSKAQVNAHDDGDADASSGSAVDRLRLSTEVEDAVAPTEDVSTTPEDANDVRPVDAAASSRRVMPVDAHHHHPLVHDHHQQLQSVETGASSSSSSSSAKSSSQRRQRGVRGLMSPNIVLRRMLKRIADACQCIAESSAFQLLITMAIVLAAVFVWLATNQSMSTRQTMALSAVDMFVKAIFAFECGVKIIAERSSPWRYFYSGWNCFDFVVTAGSFLPVTGRAIAVLRLFRLLRILRIVRALSQLQLLVKSVSRAVSAIAFIGLLLALYVYFFAVLGTIFFGANDPQHFGALHTAVFTVFDTITLDNWSDVMYVSLFGCANYVGMNSNAMCTNSQPQFALTVIYFVSLVMSGSLVLLSLFIGVITMTMEEAAEEERHEHEHHQQQQHQHHQHQQQHQHQRLHAEDGDRIVTGQHDHVVAVSVRVSQEARHRDDDGSGGCDGEGSTRSHHHSYHHAAGGMTVDRMVIRYDDSALEHHVDAVEDEQKEPYDDATPLLERDGDHCDDDDEYAFDDGDRDGNEAEGYDRDDGIDDDDDDDDGHDDEWVSRLREQYYKDRNVSDAEADDMSEIDYAADDPYELMDYCADDDCFNAQDDDIDTDDELKAHAQPPGEVQSEEEL